MKGFDFKSTQLFQLRLRFQKPNCKLRARNGRWLIVYLGPGAQPGIAYVTSKFAVAVLPCARDYFNEIILSLAVKISNHPSSFARSQFAVLGGQP